MSKADIEGKSIDIPTNYKLHSNSFKVGDFLFLDLADHWVMRRWWSVRICNLPGSAEEQRRDHSVSNIPQSAIIIQEGNQCRSGGVLLSI